ncbi:hypothetical protein ScalyP_jg3195 [Parmales sp. scaly parma]|nr:hypothetical protein ScalyP_jg3195 [Parmales sp. scaly parma]
MISRVASQLRTTKYSASTTHNGVVYLSGLVPSHVNTFSDITSQAKNVLAQAEQHLLDANSRKGNILRAEIFLSDFNDSDAFNEVWESWLDPSSLPARMVVQATPIASDPRHLIKVVLTAAAIPTTKTTEQL